MATTSFSGYSNGTTLATISASFANRGSGQGTTRYTVQSNALQPGTWAQDEVLYTAGAVDRVAITLASGSVISTVSIILLLNANTAGTAGYVANISPTQVEVIRNGVWYDSFTVSLGTLSADTEFEFRHDGSGVLTFYQNGSLLGTFSTDPSPLSGGYCGFMLYDDGAAGSIRALSFRDGAASGNSAPAFSSSPVTTATEGVAYSYSITCTDANAGDTLTITAPTKPAWLTITDNGNRTGTLSGTPASGDVGSNSVVLQVGDGTTTTQQSFSITVSAAGGGGGGGGGSGLTNQDTASHPPPTTGSASTYDYNLFTPAASNFPALGQTYTDPVFGGIVRRISNIGSNVNQEDIYAHNWANADGTMVFHRTTSSHSIISPTTGAVLYANQPLGDIGYDIAWDAVDPDKYYFFSGASLVRRNLAAQTNTTIKTFPATLESMGGSLNYQSSNGRYFVVRYSGTGHVWDSQTDTIYTGAPPPGADTGWMTITPDGNYLVTAGGGAYGFDHISYAINHGTQTVSTSGVMFWSRCGDHGVVVSATDGKNYFVTSSCYYSTGIYRVDITLDQSAASDAAQLAANQFLIPLTWADSFHATAVSKGTYRDWVFIDTENQGGNFNDTTSGWYAYRDEIIGINVVTLEVRRFCHHRSRAVGVSYYNQPRISCAWDGSQVFWASNYNDSTPTGYSDLYIINNPLSISGGGGAPTNTPPTGTNATFTINEDSSKTFSSSDFGYSDADADAFTAVRIDSLPSIGALRLAGVSVTSGQVIPVANIPTLVFTPAANGNGTPYATFTFSVQDAQGAFDTAPNSITINVTAVNDAPVVVFPIPDQAATAGTAFSYQFPSNTFTDIDGDTLTYSATTLPSWLTFTAGTRMLTGTPSSANLGAHTVVIRASDTNGLWVQDTFVVNVGAVGNTAPIVSYPLSDRTATAGTAFSYRPIAFATDANQLSNTLTYSLTTAPMWLGMFLSPLDGGTLVFSGTPSSIDIGVSSVVVRATDNGGLWVEDTFTITVQASTTNTAPSAVDDVVTTQQDTAVVIDVLANDVDLDGDTLALSSFTQGSFGSVVASQGKLVYTPNAGWSGTDSVSYTISDGRGGTDTGTVTITVTPAVVSVNAADDSVTTYEGVPVTFDPRTNDSGGASAMSVVGVTQPQHGVAVFTAHNVTYTPATLYFGNDVFTYTLSDGTTTDVATINVVVKQRAVAVKVVNQTNGVLIRVSAFPRRHVLWTR